MKHEQATIRSFIVRHKRERYLGFLSKPKTWAAKFTQALAHFGDIEPGCKRSIPPSKQNPRDIARILIAKGSPGFCYVMSEHPDWDGRDWVLLDALEEVVGSDMGTIISCIPGQLAFLETEDERCILEKAKKPLRPPQRIRFIASKIHPGSNLEEGIFQPAYRLRDDWEVDQHQREELGRLLGWFELHLPSPAVLDDPRNSSAISWFKSESEECISMVWSLVHILEENGVIIRKIRTGQPGHVLYEDDFQIVATPFGKV